MKKLVSFICIFVYLFFSQFVIKAVATTDSWWELEGDFCINEQLDTLESKRNCREKNNSWVFSFFSVANSKLFINHFAVAYSSSEFEYEHILYPNQYHSHDPPDRHALEKKEFVDEYVWIVLLLL